MHRSAASFFSKTISAMTVGLAVSIMQLTIFPRGSIAVLTSSAVVPGARFDARTTKGPAKPFIESPEACLEAPRMLNPTSTPFFGAVGGVGAIAPCNAVKRRLFDNCAATEGVIDEGRGVGLFTREANGLFL